MIKMISQALSSKVFLLLACSIIFLLSIFIRSTIDIGSDTGIYLDLGKKVAHGGRYYYDFFESNFPISFYFYALEYCLSQFLHLNPIITSDIVINLLAICSIAWSAKILQKTTIYDNKAHYHLIIIAYMLGFFLRIGALEMGEFGTKSSLLLICLYPYVSFSFERKEALTQLETVLRGCVMGLIGCLKPHYLVFILLIELHRFWQKKSFRFFFQLDQLIMVLMGVFYLVLMIYHTPEFFEFMVPMWSLSYSPYNDAALFFSNLLYQFTSKTIIYSFIFLIFSRLPFSYNDKVLTLLFCAVSLLIGLESIGTIDQYTIFYAIVTICFAKFVYDFLTSDQFSFRNNQFIIICLIALPVFDLEYLPWSIFSMTGFINIWWFVVLCFPFFFIRKIKKEKPAQYEDCKTGKHIKLKMIGLCTLYVICVISAILALIYFSKWAFVAINLTSLGVILFCIERVYARFYRTFSSFMIFVVMVTITHLFYAYIVSITLSLQVEKNSFQSPNGLSEAIAYYSKLHAPEKKDGILVFSRLNDHQFPIINYLGKDNYYNNHLVTLRVDVVGEKTFFSRIDELDRIFTLTYFFENLKAQIKADDIKVLFINTGPALFTAEDRCLIGYLEYYYLDPAFRSLFLQYFHYQGRIISSEKTKPSRTRNFDKGNVFNALEPSTQKVFYDFEVYVRND